MENMCKEYLNVVHLVLISVLHFGSGGVGNRQWGQYTVQNTNTKSVTILQDWCTMCVHTANQG